MEGRDDCLVLGTNMVLVWKEGLSRIAEESVLLVCVPTGTRNAMRVRSLTACANEPGIVVCDTRKTTTTLSTHALIIHYTLN